VAAQARAQTAWRVVFASSLGTVFEWYDFYLYGSLAVFFGGLFFPPGNETAALLASLATFGAGFAVRPFGAVLFGRAGDTRGRKRTFVLTTAIMGAATALVGVLPTYDCCRGSRSAASTAARPRTSPSTRRRGGGGCTRRSSRPPRRSASCSRSR
jgi:MFS family permease